MDDKTDGHARGRVNPARELGLPARLDLTVTEKRAP